MTPKAVKNLNFGGKKMKKRVFLAAIMTLFALPQIAFADDVTIMVNGEKLVTETPAVIENERTLVPLRAVSDALGCDVSWDGETRGVTVTDGESLFFTWIGRDHAFETTSTELENTVILDTPPMIINDFTMVPVRAVSEIFGAEVGYDAATSTVLITYDKKSVKAGLAAEFRTYETELDKMYGAYCGYADHSGNLVNAEIQLANGGVITLELYPDIAPETVANFVKLANEKFYDGLVFHRVIKDFMIQGGGFDQNLTQKTAAAIKGEFIVNGSFNLIPHERGTVSMARTQYDLNSASSQFFIMQRDTPSLNGQYAAFGRVTGGMEYVDDIASKETHTVEKKNGSMDDVPVENQIIKTVVIK